MLSKFNSSGQGVREENRLLDNVNTISTAEQKNDASDTSVK
jgi:hypothetical protein